MLSLLLIIPLLCTQLWAVSGGPYNSLNSREISAFSGTYGVSMRGMLRVPLGVRADDQSVVNKPLVYRESDPGNDNDVSTTAVLYLTVPNSGIVNGKIMLFHKGLMYIGTSTGMVERRRMSILMLSELTHYIVLSGNSFRETVSENIPIPGQTQQTDFYRQGVGLTGSPSAVMDSMLAGQIDLTLSLNEFTGLITVDGWANYVEVGAELSTASANVLMDVGYRSSPNRDYSQQSTPTFATSELKYTGRSVARDIVTSQMILNGGTVVAGTWKMQLVENVRQPENTKVNGLNGIKLKAEGARNTTETVAIANFIAPRSGTYWQIWGGIPSDLYGANGAQGSGGDGAAAATAALAAVSNVANNVVGGTQVTSINTGTNGSTLNPIFQGGTLFPGQFPVPPANPPANQNTPGSANTNPAVDPTFVDKFMQFLDSLTNLLP